MRNAINNFAKQFAYDPKIVNGPIPKKPRQIIVLGMGGSALAAKLLRAVDPTLPMHIHSDYGLPYLDKATQKKTLIIASSYSGNTEEVLDGYAQAHRKKINTIAISTGGKLLATAKKAELPYIELPNWRLQPREALGLSMRALLKALEQNTMLHETKKLAQMLQPDAQEATGKRLAEKFRGCIPVIYTSTQNAPLGYIWKIKYNETSKIPAFANVIPELNHNEINGFDAAPRTRELIQKFHFIFLQDASDHPKIKKRMGVLKKLYLDSGLLVTTITLNEKDIYQKIFNCIVLADWVTFHLALYYGVEPRATPLVAEFKELMEDKDPSR